MPGKTNTLVLEFLERRAAAGEPLTLEQAPGVFIRPARPDRDAISAHLYALFPPGFVHHWGQYAQIEIVYAPPDRPLIASRWYSAFDLKAIVDFVEVRAACGDNVYVGAALRHGQIPEKGRGKTENFLAASCAWIEYDAAGDAERVYAILRERQLKPAFIVTTGLVPYLRQHVYFKIRDGIADPAKLKAVNTALRDLFGSDDVTDAIRIMRLAGCVNHPTARKTERGYVIEPVTIKAAREPHEYSADRLGANVSSGKHSNDPLDFNDARKQGEARRSTNDLFELLQQSRTASHWHNSMRDAIATMIGRNWSDDQIRLACGAYCKHGPSDPDLGPLIETARTKWNRPDGTTAQPSSLQPQSSDLEFIDMMMWDQMLPPPRQWAVLDRIPLLQPCLLSGEGGIGKTILLLQLGAATALGREWIGALPEPGPVIYLGAEDDADELHRRLAEIVKHYGMTFAHLHKRMFVTSYAGKDATLARFDRDGRMMPMPLYAQLYERACEIKPKLILLDTVSDIFAGNENDRTHVSAFLGMLRGLAMASSSAVIINTHPSLTGINSGSGLSGTTAWHNRVRSRMYFKPAHTDEKGEDTDPDLRVLEFKKSNYGPISESILLRWRNGVFVPEPRAGSVEQQRADHAMEELFMSLLARFSHEGRNVSDKTGTSYAPARFADEPEAKAAKAAKEALAGAMRRLFAAEKIRVVTEGPVSHRRSRLMIVGGVS